MLMEWLWNLVTAVHYNNLEIIPVVNRLLMNKFNVLSTSSFYVLLFLGCAVATIYFMMAMATLVVKEKSKEENEFEEKKAPFVTIQIPTKNEIIALRCAKKCLEFDYPKDKYEILIGDDSTDKTVSRRLDEFARNHRKVRIIRRKENVGFKPGNLNNMLKHTNGEIIVLFDSDFVPDTDFLKRIVTPFIYDKKVSAVQARWKFTNADENMITAMASSIVYTFHHVSLSLIEKFGIGFLCGSAEAVRKKDLIKLGGWRSGSLTEDIEFSLRLHKDGKRILYLPKLECYNEAPSRPIDLYRQQMRWGGGVISAYKLHTPGIWNSSRLSTGKKFLSMMGCCGYLFPVVLLMLFTTGFLSFITHTPEPINLAKFSFETARNILLTSGLLITNILALYKAGKLKIAGKVLLSSFSFGLVTVYYVNVGIAKAILGKHIDWYLLNKSKNLNSRINQK